MGYGDNRYGGGNDRQGGSDRWQGRDQGGSRWERERGSYGDWGSDRGRGGNRGSGNEDRGFFERAADQARSWFSDDDDRGDRGQRMSGQGGGQGSDWGRGGASFGGGFGNQRGWSDQHYDRQYGPEQGRSQSGDRDRGQQEGYTGGGGNRSSWGGGGGGPELFGGSGFGGLDDHGRRFDRIDPGHVGAQGAHPMSAPVDSGYGGGAGISPGGGAGSSAARYAAIGMGGERHIDKAKLLGDDRGGAGQGSYGSRGGYGGGHHDPNYSEWRQRQIEQLDRDYHDYRQEHQSKFEQDFGGWREKRQTQRQHLGRVTEHMEVVGSDGERIGTVDKVRDGRIILTKNDPNAGGVHHSIPCSWIESVDERVTVNKTAQQAVSQWESEEQNRALFERGDEGSGGPHMLNRSFSNTYSDDDK
jgi:hypothetical protein